MAQIQYKSYFSMRAKIRRNVKKYPCLKQYASLTTLLLDTFIKNNGYLASKQYYGSRFEVPGKTYTTWINELKEALVIEQFKTEGNAKSDFIRFSAGPLIVEYINLEKVKSKEIATVDDVFPRVEQLEERVSLLETAVKSMIEEYDPPVTEEKFKRRLTLIHGAKMAAN